ncbi:hypothetical protein C8J56DRAFT_1062777 [Mycena floridula]|nr:hypothetical protein C8J56DRAFT_1062777 [Mycena floridula]
MLAMELYNSEPPEVKRKVIADRDKEEKHKNFLKIMSDEQTDEKLVDIEDKSDADSLSLSSVLFSKPLPSTFIQFLVDRMPETSELPGLDLTLLQFLTDNSDLMENLTELPVFFITGIVTHPDGLKVKITEIYAETAAEELDEAAEDPVHPQDVLLFTPVVSEEENFLADLNMASGPMKFYVPAHLPQVIICFPSDPALFVNWKVRVEFSICSFHPDYNLFTILPSYLHLFKLGSDEYNIYMSGLSGYLLFPSSTMSDSDSEGDDEDDSDWEGLPHWWKQ